MTELKRTILFNMVVLLFSVFIPLVLAEFYLRAVWLPKQATPSRLACEYDKDLGWKKIPNVSVVIKTNEYENREILNSKGLRGPEYPYERTLPSYRILLLGDSFVEGYSVGERDLFSNILEQQLRLKLPRDVEVINMGTGGYSTDQEYLEFVTEGNKYQADIVILFFYYNDLLYNLRADYNGYPKPFYKVSKSGLSLRNVPVPRTVGHLNPIGRYLNEFAILQLAKKAWARTLIRISDSELVQDNESDCFLPVSPEWVEQAWRITNSLLLEFKASIKKQGGRFVVVYVPAQFELNEALLSGLDGRKRIVPEQVSSRLRDLCAQNAIDYLNLKPEFMRHKSQRPFYYPVDGHWTVEGHHLVAGYLSQQILNSMEKSK